MQQCISRDIVCFRNIHINTLHKGDDDDDDNNNNNNRTKVMKQKKKGKWSKALKCYAVPMLSDHCENVTTVRWIGRL
jgi:hypothetical protein